MLADGDDCADGEKRFKLDVLTPSGVNEVASTQAGEADRINFAGFFGTIGFSRIFSDAISLFVLLFVDVSTVATIFVVGRFDGIGCTCTVGLPPKRKD